MTNVALDTSCGVSIAVSIDGEHVVREHQALTGRDSDRALVPWLKSVLAKANLGIGEVEAWTVGTGPGSFSGLRVGIALAKGICAATGARLRGLPSSLALSLEAAGHEAVDRDVGVLHDARRGQLVVSRYHWDGAVMKPEEEPFVTVPEEIGHALCSDLYVTPHGPAVVPLLGPTVSSRLIQAECVAAERLLDPHGWPWPAAGVAVQKSCEPVYVRPAVFVAPRPVRSE